MKNGMIKTEINDTLTYVSNKAFTFQLEDDKSRKFGVLFETINMMDATGEDEFKEYPFLVSASLMVNKPHASFYEGEGEVDQLDLMSDVNSYMGGVPVDHILANQINSGFKGIAKHFHVTEACIRVSKSDFGTIAAQQGKGAKHRYLQFKTEEAAQKYVRLLTKRARFLSTMIGFILDAPINMAGNTGWSVFESQVKGK